MKDKALKTAYRDLRRGLFKKVATEIRKTDAEIESLTAFYTSSVETQHRLRVPSHVKSVDVIKRKLNREMDRIPTGSNKDQVKRVLAGLNEEHVTQIRQWIRTRLNTFDSNARKILQATERDLRDLEGSILQKMMRQL